MSESHDTLTVVWADRRDAVGIRLVIRAAMAVYMRESAIPAPVEAMAEDLVDTRRHIDEDRVLVAKMGMNIIGTLRLSWESAGHAYLSRFAVLPGSQSRGVGSLLFAAAERYLLAAGARSVRLHTALGNKPLVQFYKNRGFELAVCSEERGYPRALLVKTFPAHRQEPAGSQAAPPADG